PPSPNIPRVFACVETSANEYVGLTEATGEFLSQVWERSIKRAFFMMRRRSRAFSESSSASTGANWVRQNAAKAPASIARAERCVRNVGSDTDPSFKVYGKIELQSGLDSGVSPQLVAPSRALGRGSRMSGAM